MKALKLVAAALLAAAGLAQAATHSETVIKEFENFAGFGVKYTIDWESNVALSWNASLSETRFNHAPGVTAYREIDVAIGMVPIGDLQSYSAIEFSAAATISFIRLADGANRLPDEFYTTGWRQRFTSFSADVGGGSSCTTPNPLTEIRFSNPRCAAAHELIVGEVQPNGVPAATAAATARALYQAGNVLLPSDDPDCASFACMTPAHDLITRNGFGFSAVAAVGTIPEPSTYALFALGLAGLFSYTRRREA